MAAASSRQETSYRQIWRISLGVYLMRAARPGATTGSPCCHATSGAGSRRVGQWCKVRPVAGGPEKPGSTRKITRTTSSATSMRLTRVQMMSRFVAQSTPASRSCTIVANRSSLPITRCSERTWSGLAHRPPVEPWLRLPAGLSGGATQPGAARIRAFRSGFR
jgi:hypothetical protein